MRAVVQDRYGTADVLRVTDDVPVPTPAAHQVLVRVAAAGLDRGVWHLMAGLPYPVRLAGYGVRAPKGRIRGRELAGRVVAVGAEVTGLAVGDDVFGVGEGTFAQYAVSTAALLAPAPRSVSAESAAVVPISGTTALQALRDHGRVRSGQQVLVLGASGGVGSFAVQIAKGLGAQVTGVASTAKLDLVRSLGADVVLDYTRDELPQDRYDVVIDTGGNSPLRRLRRVMTRDGRLVIVGAETGGRWLGGTDRQLRAMLLDPLVRHRLGSFMAKETAADLTALAGLIDSGVVRPVVDRACSLDQVPDAVRRLQAGEVRGKLVVRP
jgi:NADPH:quinone reductase-like Zn-dependent oxidoreductase